jgi:hypothetical protein
VKDERHALTDDALARPSVSQIAAYLRLDAIGPLGSGSPGKDAEYWVDLLTRRQARPADQARPRRTRQASSPAARQHEQGAMVSAAEAARICGISRTTWYKLRAAGRVPAPVRLARRVL